MMCRGRNGSFYESSGTYCKSKLGNTILVKLKLWELVRVFNNNFYSVTNLCLRYASAKCAGNLTFRGIVFCNLGPLKQLFQILSPRGKIVTPYSSPCKYGYPNNVPVGRKNDEQTKKSASFLY
jgi:hypothetical protein